MNRELAKISRRELAEALDRADDQWQHAVGSGGYDMSDPLGYWLMLADAALKALQ